MGGNTGVESLSLSASPHFTLLWESDLLVGLSRLVLVTSLKLFLKANLPLARLILLCLQKA